MCIKQMFGEGDLVHIKAEMPGFMSHFEKDKDAIVVEYSRNQCQEGSEFEHSYSLYIQGVGKTSWYHNFNMDLIEKNRMDLLKTWKKEKGALDALYADLDWIFSHGKEVLKGASGATVGALAKCLKFDNLWGSRGEGITYYQNAHAILSYAEPYLLIGDKEGWLGFCKEYQESVY